MSILSDIGTKIGTKIKEITTSITILQNDLTNTKLPYHLEKHRIGSSPPYHRCVIPLCEIDNTNITKFSYTSGRFDFIKHNGNVSQLPLHIEIKMQKQYNTASPMWFIMHNNLPTNMRPCKFTKNGQLYGGLEIYYTVNEHTCYFMGITTLSTLYNSKISYWHYQDVRDDSITDTEIKNSLVIL